MYVVIAFIVGAMLGVFCMAIVSASKDDDLYNDYFCKGCVHNDEPWFSEACEPCCQAMSNYERKVIE